MQLADPGRPPLVNGSGQCGNGNRLRDRCAHPIGPTLPAKYASSPRLLSALKMGTPLTARAIAPRNRSCSAEIGLSDSSGASGICQALSPDIRLRERDLLLPTDDADHHVVCGWETVRFDKSSVCFAMGCRVVEESAASGYMGCTISAESSSKTTVGAGSVTSTSATGSEVGSESAAVSSTVEGESATLAFCGRAGGQR